MNTRAVAEKMQALGRGGDTVLAHINAKEVALLKRHGGRGSRNPKTGLLEFFDGDAPGDAAGPVTGDSAIGTGTSSDGTPTAALGDVTITGSPPASPGGDLSFDVPFDMSMIPDADPRGGVGNMEGLPVPPTFMDNLIKKGQNLAKGIAISKGLGMLTAATGIPGVVFAGGLAAMNAANSAPPGQSQSAVANSLGNTVSGTIANTATDGVFGMLSSIGITPSSVFGDATGPAPSGDTTGGSEGGLSGAVGPTANGASALGYNPAIDYLRGGYGLYQANKLAQLAKGTAAEQAAGGQLQSLISDPSSITKTPGYEAGLQAVQRAAAGKGYLASGNLSVALAKFGTDFYNNSLSTLDQIANRNASIRQQNRNNSIALAGQALNSLGYGFGRSNRGAPVQQRPYTDAGMRDQANTYTEAPVMAPSDLGDFYG